MELALGVAGRDEAYRSFEANASREQRAAFAQFVRRQRRWLLPYGLFELCSARFEGAPWWSWPEPFRRRLRRAAARVPRRGSRASFARSCSSSICSISSGPRSSATRTTAACICSAICRSTWISTASRFGGRARCSRSTRTANRAASRACRRTTSTRTASSGATRSTTGTRCSAAASTGGSRGSRRSSRGSTSCASTISALSSRTGRCARARKTAREGAWRPGRGTELLTALRAKLGEIPLVAEDLGIITDEVRALRDRFGLPGMVVAQFAFDGTRRQPALARESRRRTPWPTPARTTTTRRSAGGRASTPARATA